MTALFIQKVSVFGPRLMHDFGISAEDAAACFGNLGHESGGFAHLQEMGKRAGSGGYGWGQWTGARRHAFEAWCHTHGLAPASDAANYGYLCFELHGAERGAITAMKKCVGLDAKVRAFERVFERAGVPAIPHRVTWAKLALSAIQHVQGKGPAPEPIQHTAAKKAAARKPAAKKATVRKPVADKHAHPVHHAKR